MNKGQIDKLFNSFSDREFLMEFADIDTDYNVMYEENYEKLLRKVMLKIESDEEIYKYFSSFRENPIYTYIYVQLMCYSTKVEDIKQCIEDSDDLNIYGFGQLANLIIATNDTEYIENCIEEWLRGKRYDLENWDILKLIKAMGEEYIEDCIENRKEEFDFSQEEFLELVKSANSKFISKYIEREKDNLSYIELIELIKATKDSEYIESCIENRDTKFDFEFEHNDIINLIKLTRKQYIQSCIENRREELKLSHKDIMELLAATKDEEYICLCLEKRRTELGLDSSSLFELISMAETKKTARNYVESFYKGIRKEKSDKFVINLPETMTTGVEIESEGKRGKRILGMTDMFGIDWECKEDETLGNGIYEQGVEVVSPKLTGNNAKSSEEIRKVCTMLKEFRQKITRRCGGHIHQGAHHLTNVQAWKNFIELWCNTEEIMYIISNAEGEIPREGVLQQAKPISAKFKDAINCGVLDFKNETDVEGIISKIKEIQGSGKINKFYGINFQNLGTKRNTIEFRIANGTLDADTWIQNINLFGGIIKVAQDLSIIQKKSEDERTEEEKEKIKCFERITRGELEDNEKLQELLKLVIQEFDREVYERRYTINKRIIETEPEFYKKLKCLINTGKIEMKKEEIGDAIFAGEEKPTGEDYVTTVQMISGAIEKQRAGIVQE